VSQAAPPGALADPESVRLERRTVVSTTGTVPYILGRPRDGRSRAGLLLLHEAFGLNPHIEDMVARFAGLGFVVAAPDLYHAIGAPTPTDMTSVLNSMFTLRDADVIADLRAVGEALREAGAECVGCLGFCAGGRYSLLAACSEVELDAAVDCWGGYLDRASETDVATPARPVPPMNLLAGAQCPIFLVGGAEDTNPSPAILEQVYRLLDEAGKEARLRLYEDAGHAFFADYRPSYRERAAHQFWPELLRFLNTTLGPVPAT
jgi:carboxymethylenebutenolidase